jgi:hypothetical protein
MKLWKALVILFCVLLGSGVGYGGFLSTDPGLSPGQTLPPGLIIPGPIISNPQLSGLITTVPGSTLWVQGNVQYEPYAIIAGPDGSVWNYNGLSGLASLTMSGVLTFVDGSYWDSGGLDVNPNSMIDGPDGSVWSSTGLNNLRSLNMAGPITFNGVPLGGACAANNFMVALSTTVIPTCAPITSIPGPVTINNPTFTGTVTGPDGGTWTSTGISLPATSHITVGYVNITGTMPGLTFNGVAMGGACAAGDFVNSINANGVPACGTPSGGGGSLPTPVSIGNGGLGQGVAPNAGQMLVASGPTAYNPVTVTGDVTFSTSGVTTVHGFLPLAGGQMTGNIGFSNGGRITGNMSGAPRVNRFAFQDDGTAGGGLTNVGILPPTGSQSSYFTIYGSTDVDNSPFIQAGISGGTTAGFTSNAFGTGTVLPFSFTVGTSAIMTLSTSGLNLTTGNFQVNGVNFGGTCPANQYVTVVSPAVIPTCAAVTTVSGVAGPFAVQTNPAGGANNYAPLASPTFTGTVTAPSLTVTGSSTLASVTVSGAMNFGASGSLTFNGVAMGGTCPAGQFMNSLSSTAIPGCATTGVTVASAAPASPSLGQLWFNTADVQTYIYYNDGTSSQWVPVINNGSGGNILQNPTFSGVVTMPDGVTWTTAGINGTLHVNGPTSFASTTTFTGAMTFPDGSIYTAAGHNSMAAVGIGQAVGTDPLDITRNQNGGTWATVLNNSTGASAQAGIEITTGTSGKNTFLAQNGSGNTGSTITPANSGYLYSDNGVALVAGFFGRGVYFAQANILLGTFSTAGNAAGTAPNLNIPNTTSTGLSIGDFNIAAVGNGNMNLVAGARYDGTNWITSGSGGNNGPYALINETPGVIGFYYGPAVAGAGSTVAWQPVASVSNGALQLRSNAHFISVNDGVAAPAVICNGVAASVVGNDTAGTFTVSTTSASSCLVTFGRTYPNSPACSCSIQGNWCTAALTNTGNVTLQFGTAVTSARGSWNCTGWQ